MSKAIDLEYRVLRLLLSLRNRLRKLATKTELRMRNSSWVRSNQERRRSPEQSFATIGASHDDAYKRDAPRVRHFDPVYCIR